MSSVLELQTNSIKRCFRGISTKKLKCAWYGLFRTTCQIITPFAPFEHRNCEQNQKSKKIHKPFGTRVFAILLQKLKLVRGVRTDVLSSRMTNARSPFCARHMGIRFWNPYLFASLVRFDHTCYRECLYITLRRRQGQDVLQQETRFQDSGNAFFWKNDVRRAFIELRKASFRIFVAARVAQLVVCLFHNIAIVSWNRARATFRFLLWSLWDTENGFYVTMDTESKYPLFGMVRRWAISFLFFSLIDIKFNFVKIKICSVRSRLWSCWKSAECKLIIQYIAGW